MTPPTTADTRPEPRRIAVAPGDGVGPEITEAVLRILDAAQVPLAVEEVVIGERAYLDGVASGVPQDAWAAIRETGVLLKGPITTPQGGGYKSCNVTLRKSLNLFANVRQSKAFSPFVSSSHPDMNVVVVRENEEDLYAGIEHRQTPEVTQVLKLITRPGTERIVRYAFEYARAYGRRKVTCMTKDNIMKVTDGLFHKVFDEIAAEYPDITSDHMIIDIGAARLAVAPERFDVVVTLNLYGDIISDIAAELSGSIGMAGSANIGESAAMFEAVHGSAPDIAGRGVANPSGLLVAAVHMLVHIGMPDAAQLVKNAWLATLESGARTPDMASTVAEGDPMSTGAFTDAVIAHLGEQPSTLEPVSYAGAGVKVPESSPTAPVDKQLVGIDVFCDWDEAGRDPETLATELRRQAGDGLDLQMMTNRGVMVWPEGMPETFRTDHWRCRFTTVAGDVAVNPRAVVDLLGRLVDAGVDVIKTEHLYTFDGEAGFSVAQGQ